MGEDVYSIQSVHNNRHLFLNTVKLHPLEETGIPLLSVRAIREPPLKFFFSSKNLPSPLPLSYLQFFSIFAKGHLKR
jgi:hypothetical protein